MASSPEKQELIGGKLKKVKLRKRELPTAEKAANVDLLVYDCIEQLQLRGSVVLICFFADPTRT